MGGGEGKWPEEGAQEPTASRWGCQTLMGQRTPWPEPLRSEKQVWKESWVQSSHKDPSPLTDLMPQC